MLYVVDSEFPVLLGRDWIRSLYGADWLAAVVQRQVKATGGSEGQKLSKVILRRKRC